MQQTSKTRLEIMDRLLGMTDRVCRNGDGTYYIQWQSHRYAVINRQGEPIAYFRQVFGDDRCSHRQYTTTMFPDTPAEGINLVDQFLSDQSEVFSI